MKKVYIACFCLCLFLVACATKGASLLNNISLGMSKEQVVSEMGTPSTTRAISGNEFLIYQLSNKRVSCAVGTAVSLGAAAINDSIGCQGEEYFIKFENGKAIAYGKVGDFNSTKDPTMRILLD